MTNFSKPSVSLVTETNSDLAIVNCARVSFSKSSSKLPDGTLSKEDQGLIGYLAKHDHWSPFAHCSEVFTMDLTDGQLLEIYERMRCSLGFSVLRLSTEFAVNSFMFKGSLYGWARELKVFPKQVQDTIAHTLHLKYPVAAKALGIQEPTLRGHIGSYGRFLPESHGSGLSDQELTVRASKAQGGHTLEALANFTSVTLRVKAPLFIARQLEKHHGGFQWNEVSRRYVQDEPEFLEAKGFRAKPKPDPVTGKVSNKQGSSDDCVQVLEQEFHSYWGAKLAYEDSARESLKLYTLMLKSGVAPEDARIVLPQSMMTEWIWTASLSDWLRMYKLRTEEHTQAKTREVTRLVDEQLPLAYPRSWEMLRAGR